MTINKFLPRLIKNLSFICFLLVILSPQTRANDDKSYNRNLQIINQQNQVIGSFKVKVANNPSSQEKGLMFVKSLPQNYGMIFEFDQEKITNMWMKNTLISLDMIFIDKNDKIVRIFNLASPLSQEIISSLYPVKKVLEINGGIAKRINVKVGDKIKLD